MHHLSSTSLAILRNVATHILREKQTCNVLDMPFGFRSDCCILHNLSWNFVTVSTQTVSDSNNRQFVLSKSKTTTTTTTTTSTSTSTTSTSTTTTLCKSATLKTKKYRWICGWLLDLDLVLVLDSSKRRQRPRQRWAIFFSDLLPHFTTQWLCKTYLVLALGLRLSVALVNLEADLEFDIFWSMTIILRSLINYWPKTKLSCDIWPYKVHEFALY